jgi:hypothetical protein
MTFALTIGLTGEAIPVDRVRDLLKEAERIKR